MEKTRGKVEEPLVANHGEKVEQWNFAISTERRKTRLLLLVSHGGAIGEERRWRRVVEEQAERWIRRNYNRREGDSPELLIGEEERWTNQRREMDQSDYAPKIIGYLLLHDFTERDLLRLALGPESVLQSLISKVKSHLGIWSSRPPRGSGFLHQHAQRDGALPFDERYWSSSPGQLERMELMAMHFGDQSNSASTQIYLTFPADSTFKDEDVASYFSLS